MKDQNLVSIEWLQNYLGDENLVVLDASLPKPKSNPGDNPLAELQIPGSRFFNINAAFADPKSDLPHMMPSAEQFTKEAQKLGINKESLIVVYDNLGVYSSPRAWWMMKSMGHDAIYVLDGGLPEWVATGLPTEKKKVQEIAPGNFISNPDPIFFRDSKYVRNSINDTKTLVLDARSNGRFKGTEPEPRAGLRSGHIPNSINLPFPEVLDDTKLKDTETLKSQFETFEIDDKELIFSCGSGLTACIILLAAKQAGYEKLSVYDGSWSEWGQPSDLPVDKG